MLSLVLAAGWGGPGGWQQQGGGRSHDLNQKKRGKRIFTDQTHHTKHGMCKVSAIAAWHQTGADYIEHSVVSESKLL